MFRATSDFEADPEAHLSFVWSWTDQQGKEADCSPCWVRPRILLVGGSEVAYNGLSTGGYPDQLFFFNGSRGYGTILADNRQTNTQPEGLVPTDLLVLVAFEGQSGYHLNVAMAWDNRSGTPDGIHDPAALPEFFSDQHPRIRMNVLAETTEAELSYSDFAAEWMGMKPGTHNVRFELTRDRVTTLAEAQFYQNVKWSYDFSHQSTGRGWTEVMAMYRSAGTVGDWSVSFKQGDQTIQEGGKHMEALDGSGPLIFLTQDAFPGFNVVQPQGYAIKDFHFEITAPFEARGYTFLYAVHTGIDIEKATGLRVHLSHETVGGPL